MAAVSRVYDERTLGQRVSARLAALLAIGLVAVSGGLLAELNRQAGGSTSTNPLVAAVQDKESA